jgi:diguanylate cyclase (GGDEF)-like protein
MGGWRQDDVAAQTLAWSEAQLRAAVEAALQPRAPLLRLPPPLEERYDTASWRGRSRGTRAWLVVVATINLLCLGIDAVVMPDHLTEAFLARSGVSAIYLASAYLLTRRRPPWVQGATGSAAAVLLTLLAAYLSTLADGVHGERYLTAGLFASFAATIVANLPFVFTVLQAVLSVFIFLSFVLVRESAPVDMLVNSIELVVFYPLSVLAGLDMRRWIERMHRRNFLLALRDELRVEELAAANARLTKQSQTDPLTGVFNRRYFDQALERSWHAAADAGAWISVMMVDADEFKLLNDVAGHVEGDRCLRLIAMTLQSNVRNTDLVARYGGEEFVAILPGADPGTAMEVAERVRKAVESMQVAHPRQAGNRLTVSIGVASVRPDGSEPSPEAIVQDADSALYLAKAAGRNRVRLASGDFACPPLVPTEGTERRMSIVD